ncbi:cytochrome P450 [Rickettsia honei]|uniref:cytochrome P450 n=1 Tax=Rickettsia honei TaxID=37816 RepID=UPI001EE66235|nr:cytochrome P450 [Rickettsia honei]
MIIITIKISKSNRQTPIAGLTIDENGKYIEGLMVISTAAYALGRIMRDEFQEKELKDLPNFVDNNNSLIEEVFSESERYILRIKSNILELKL